jgi:phospholipid/cholesterol/gamma-HCH transport system ATP-binding protein
MPDTPQGPYIEFREVCKAFGEKVILDRVSFNVMPGETVCILGRSGVGKSVSLQLLMGFLKADSGRVIAAGEDITNFTEFQMEAIRRKVTMVFQNGALFDSLSVGENVAFPLRESRDLSEEQIYEIVDGLLKMVGVQEMGDLIKRLKIQLNLTSIVVTHDMRLAKKLADRVVFLHQGKAVFFGTSADMEKSIEPIVQEFLELDELKLQC